MCKLQPTDKCILCPYCVSITTSWTITDLPGTCAFLLLHMEPPKAQWFKMAIIYYGSHVFSTLGLDCSRSSLARSAHFWLLEKLYFFQVCGSPVLALLHMCLIHLKPEGSQNMFLCNGRDSREQVYIPLRA